MGHIKVSIICITYNHVRFIRECLNGFITQKTNFNYEVLIHDDASNDGTKEIIQEYVNKYPEIFIPFYEEENQFGKSDFCRDILYPKIRGEYVAICEGDDFWTDEFKLQKQVDILEYHKECSVCFHYAKVHWENDEKEDFIFPDENKIVSRNILNINDLLNYNFICTCSVMYRWRFHKDDLSLIPDGIIPGDWYLPLLHAQVGYIYFINSVMSVYRKHKNGIWFNAEMSEEWFKKYSIPSIMFYNYAEKQFKYNFFARKISIAMKSCVIAEKNGDTELLKNIYNISGVYPESVFCMYLKLLLLKIITPFIRGKKRIDVQMLKKTIKKCIDIKRLKIIR